MVVGQTIVAAAERHLDGVQGSFDAAAEAMARRMEQPCDEISRQVRFQIRLCAIGLDQIVEVLVVRRHAHRPQLHGGEPPLDLRIASDDLVQLLSAGQDHDHRLLALHQRF